VADCLQKFLKDVKTAGHVTKVLLSDGGKEFNCEAVQNVLEEHGISHRLTMPYTPRQNDAAEQKIVQLWIAFVLCIVPVDCRKKCGLKPAVTAVYILNRTGPTPVEGKTSLELWTGSYATLGHLRVLGTMLCAHSQSEKAQIGPKEYVGSTG
jgi:hypothetical protein